MQQEVFKFQSKRYVRNLCWWILNLVICDVFGNMAVLLNGLGGGVGVKWIEKSVKLQYIKMSPSGLCNICPGHTHKKSSSFFIIFCVTINTILRGQMCLNRRSHHSESQNSCWPALRLRNCTKEKNKMWPPTESKPALPPFFFSISKTTFKPIVPW